MMPLLIICIIFLLGFVGWELSMTPQEGNLNEDEEDGLTDFADSEVAPPDVIQGGTRQEQMLQQQAPEYISVPQQLRRFQASLKEYSKGLIQKDEEQLHRDREQSILQQLLVLGERHVDLGNLMAELKMKEVDVFSKEKSIEHKTEAINLLLNRVELQKQELENARRAAVLEVREEKHETEKEKTLLEFANERLNLDNFVSEIMQRENILELNSKKQNIQEAALQLLGKGNDLKLKEGMLDFKSEKISLDAFAAELLKREGIVDISEHKIGLKEFGIELTKREGKMDLREDKISLSERMLHLMADENKLEEGKRMLQYGNEELKQKDILSDINSGKKSLDFMLKQLSLSDQANKVEAGKREIEFGKRELSFGAEKLEHTQRVIAFKVQTSMQELKNQFNSFQFDKKSWSLQQREEKMNTYHGELRQLDTHIRQMYSVKSEWLKIQARENKLDTREQRIQLDSLLSETQSKIKELRLTRWENDMIWDKKEMERRWDIMNYLEEWWFLNEGFRPASQTLEHYQKAGYVAQSPLVQENNELRWLLSEMEKKKLK